MTAKVLTCRHCQKKFTLLPGKPGLADECPECLAPPPQKKSPKLSDVPGEFLHSAEKYLAAKDAEVDARRADRIKRDENGPNETNLIRGNLYNDFPPLSTYPYGLVKGIMPEIPLDIFFPTIYNFYF